MDDAAKLEIAATLVGGVVRIAPEILDLIRHGIDADPTASAAQALAKVLPPESASEAEARKLRARR